MKKILFIITIISFTSCSAKIYEWKGEKVTIKKFQREFNKDVDLFIKKYKPQPIITDQGEFKLLLDSTNKK